MNVVNTEAYRLAFARYVRHGTPIRLSLKNDRPTPQYVWRTQGDGRVRPEHAANEGRLFSWADPPATGHPRNGHGCRCEAVPYVRGETEYAGHEVIGSLASSYGKWDIVDFFRHFYYGEGETVTLSQIGHFRDIVEQYAYRDVSEDGIGAHRRLSDQIADKAWVVGNGFLSYEFGGPYQFEYANFPDSIPHGMGVVRGVFIGQVVDHGEQLLITGDIRFEFSDVFTDPTTARDRVAQLREAPHKLRSEFIELYRGVAENLGLDVPERVYLPDIDPDDVPEWLFLVTEIGGSAYQLKENWSSKFDAEIVKDRSQSVYGSAR